MKNRTIVRLVAWTWILPPVGLWMLWRDPELSTSAKWRILLYGVLIPLLLYLTISAWMANRALQRVGL